MIIEQRDIWVLKNILRFLDPEGNSYADLTVLISRLDKKVKNPIVSSSCCSTCRLIFSDEKS